MRAILRWDQSLDDYPGPIVDPDASTPDPVPVDPRTLPPRSDDEFFPF